MGGEWVAPFRTKPAAADAADGADGIAEREEYNCYCCPLDKKRAGFSC